MLYLPSLIIISIYFWNLGNDFITRFIRLCKCLFFEKQQASYINMLGHYLIKYTKVFQTLVVDFDNTIDTII